MGRFWKVLGASGAHLGLFGMLFVIISRILQFFAAFCCFWLLVACNCLLLIATACFCLLLLACCLFWFAFCYFLLFLLREASEASTAAEASEASTAAEASEASPAELSFPSFFQVSLGFPCFFLRSLVIVRSYLALSWFVSLHFLWHFVGSR